MINWHYECDFECNWEGVLADWIANWVDNQGMSIGQLDYIFCDDAYLLKINQEYLFHDEFTDIITFDYCEGNHLFGDIFISVERVKENAVSFGVDFKNEFLRVVAHGVLHLLGYKDKSESDASVMREKEDQMIKLFHVEH